MFDDIKKNLGELIAAAGESRYTDVVREVADLGENAADLLRKGADIVDGLFSLQMRSTPLPEEPQLAEVESLCADAQAKCCAPRAAGDASPKEFDPNKVRTALEIVRIVLDMIRKLRDR